MNRNRDYKVAVTDDLELNSMLDDTKKNGFNGKFGKSKLLTS